MPLTIFLAFCILGCNFLLCVLFQWTYGARSTENTPAARPHLGRDATPSPATKSKSLASSHSLNAQRGTEPASSDGLYSCIGTPC
jgi:hypothetical protein